MIDLRNEKIKRIMDFGKCIQRSQAICQSSTRNISMIDLRNEKMKRNMDF